jgi:glucokinase
VYDFLKATGRGAEPAWLADALAKSDDKTPVIVDAAMEGKPGSELCQQTLEIFVDVLAAESGSLALSFGATGGVYLGGGIPPRILPALQRYNFVQTFVAKTGYEYYLERFPIHVILNTDAGILGAAAFANQELIHPDSI